MSGEVFHVELRQSFHSARAFNLSRSELRAQVLNGWLVGQPLRWAERDWEPRKAKLTIIASRELRADEIGVGRGWREAVRLGEEVTERMLSAEEKARPEAVFKPLLLELCEERARSLAALVQAARTASPQVRFSEIVAVVEQATWELLHEGALSMARQEAAGTAPVAPELWQVLLLAPGSWAPDAQLRIELKLEA